MIRALGLLLLSASLLGLAQSPTIAGCLRQAQLPVLEQLKEDPHRASVRV